VEVMARLLVVAEVGKYASVNVDESLASRGRPCWNRGSPDGAYPNRRLRGSRLGCRRREGDVAEPAVVRQQARLIPLFGAASPRVHRRLNALRPVK
jgi:hypothetical protein